MIKGELIGGETLKLDAARKGPQLRAGMTQLITRLTMRLLVRVKGSKLSGQVLNVRTGKLRRSINQRVAGQDTPMVSGTVGTNLVYARPHEYGFKGKVTIREHVRTQVTAFGRSITPVQVVVGSHARNVTLPERSFLRSALADMSGEIDAQTNATVLEALK